MKIKKTTILIFGIILIILMIFLAIASNHQSQYSCANSIVGDVNGDGIVNTEDIDFLRTAINENYPDVNCDLTSDGLLDTADYVFLVENILGTLFGDVNLDRIIDNTDISTSQSNLGNTEAGWEQGNFNLDYITDSNDQSILQDNL